MNSKIIHQEGGKDTLVLVFEPGDEVVASLLAFADKRHLNAGHFTAIGGFSQVTLGYFEPEKKAYKHIDINEQVEVLSLVGNITTSAQGDSKPKLHAHVVVGKSDGSAHGGHLLRARVRPTLELVLTESPRHLMRYSDPNTGLALLKVA
jgi:predicted DNA-binding protein with PD1-like motif